MRAPYAWGWEPHCADNITKIVVVFLSLAFFHDRIQTFMLAVGGPDPRARKQPLQRFFFSPQLILQFTGRHIRSNETCLSPRGGGGGVLWYFYTYVGSAHFIGFKILNFNIFWGYQENEYFLGNEDFVDIFLGSSQNWASLRDISMQSRVFF